jgi:hypothetical protein
MPALEAALSKLDDGAGKLKGKLRARGLRYGWTDGISKPVAVARGGSAMRSRPVFVITIVLLLGGLSGLSVAAKALGSELNANDPTSSAIKCSIPPQNGMNVGMEVLVDGRSVRLIAHEGHLYLPVPRMGSEYELRVINHNIRRVTAIVSVDGLSVITSEPAADRQAGYVVDPYGNIIIKGWRRDSGTVAAFTFEERENSYAYRMGHRDNLGVIELVAFEEEDTSPRPVLRKETPVDARSVGIGVGGTGTGWGRDINSEVVQVPFVRSANRRTITIYYDTPEALRRIGVPLDGPYPRPLLTEAK